MAGYDSGGKTQYQDREKFKTNFKRIFGSQWPCKQCGRDSAKGHKDDCPNHWRNKSEQA